MNCLSACLPARHLRSAPRVDTSSAFPGGSLTRSESASVFPSSQLHVFLSLPGLTWPACASSVPLRSVPSRVCVCAPVLGASRGWTPFISPSPAFISRPIVRSFRAQSRAGGRSARERGCITALAAHSGGLTRTAPSPIGPPFISSRALSRPLSSPFELIPCTTRARLTFLPCAFRFCVLRCAFHRYPAAGQSSRASGSCARLSPSAAGYLCPSPRALAPRVP